MKTLMKGAGAALKAIAQAGKVYFTTTHGCSIFVERFTRKESQAAPVREKQHTGPPDRIPLKKAC